MRKKRHSGKDRKDSAEIGSRDLALCSEEQIDEVQALEAIYIEDGFKMLCEETERICFSIQILPHDDDDYRSTDEVAKVTLRVGLPPLYPKIQPPDLDVFIESH